MELATRVSCYPGFVITALRSVPVGTGPAIPVGMQQLALTVDQAALIEENVAVAATAAVAASSALADDDALMSMPLSEAKHLVAAEFERRYLLRVMARAGGSVSEGARVAGLDRTNFRRLLQRHDLR